MMMIRHLEIFYIPVRYTITGDDGMHASNAAVIDGGTITVEPSVSTEGTNVTNEGIRLSASDDGINASSKVTGAEIFIKITEVTSR